jgi:hypothetical protein
MVRSEVGTGFQGRVEALRVWFAAGLFDQVPFHVTMETETWMNRRAPEMDVRRFRPSFVPLRTGALCSPSLA